MKRLFTIIICLLGLTTNGQEQVLTELDDKYEKYADLSLKIWDYAELGYLEEKSSNLLRSTLAEEGFTITSGVADIPTAFEASYGSGEPVIGIMAEYDALPGVSQAAVPTRQTRAAGLPVGN